MPVTSTPTTQSLRLGREFDGAAPDSTPDIFGHTPAGEGFVFGLVDFDLVNDVVSLAVSRSLWSDRHAFVDYEVHTLGVPVPRHATFAQIVAFVEDPVTRPAVCVLINTCREAENAAAFAEIRDAHARHFGPCPTLISVLS